jgi:hypothetical protein
VATQVLVEVPGPLKKVVVFAVGIQFFIVDAQTPLQLQFFLPDFLEPFLEILEAVMGGCLLLPDHQIALLAFKQGFGAITQVALNVFSLEGGQFLWVQTGIGTLDCLEVAFEEVNQEVLEILAHLGVNLGAALVQVGTANLELVEHPHEQVVQVLSLGLLTVLTQTQLGHLLAPQCSLSVAEAGGA